MNYTLESFITFCDDMYIAEEGFKDIGSLIIKGVKTIWNAFLTLIVTIKTKIKEFFAGKFESKKSLRANNEELRIEKEKLEKELESMKDKYKYMSNARDKERDRAVRDEKIIGDIANSMDLTVRTKDNTHSKEKDKLKNKIDTLESKIKDLENQLEKTTSERDNYKLESSEYKSSVDNTNSANNLRRYFGSGIDQLYNAIDFGITKHFKIAEHMIGKMESLRGPADIYNFEEKYKLGSSENGLKSWLEANNSRPGAHLDRAKEYFSKCREIVDETEFDHDNYVVLKAFFREYNKEIDKLKTEMAKGKEQLDRMVSTANSFKEKRTKDKALSGLNGCFHDWETIMATVTKAGELGLYILKNLLN